jgi:hypothetical protein
MRVLVACEFSNIVRDAFIRRGHDAYSCDLQRADHPNQNFRRHIRGDVRPLLRERWDLVIAHPPCTYLSVASNCQLKLGLPLEEQPRELGILYGVLFFLDCLDANTDRVCVENPLPNKFGKRLLPHFTQIIHPWQYGHQVTKRTCLWLRGLPSLIPTNIVEPTHRLVTKSYTEQKGLMPTLPGVKDANDRSRTFIGIANAMAEQWGNL